MQKRLSNSEVKEIVEMTKLEVWVQSIDPIDPGAHTGAILPEAVKEDGATGTFLNHSEKKLDDYNLLSKSINQASRAGLKTLVFAGDINELRKVVGLKPTLVAYEPPELVGSRDKSVARLPLIVGAGIKSAEDVRVSLRLGAMGVAVASDVVKADDPEKELLDLVKGLEG